MPEQTFTTRLGASLRARGLFGSLAQAWIHFWMLFAGTGPAGRLAAWLVTWFAPPHYSRWWLSSLNARGFVAPSATLHGREIHLGANVFLDDRTLLFQGEDGGPIHVGAGAILSRDTVFETLKGGSITVGERASFHPHCYLSAAQGSIRIGAGVGVGPYCAFYPHNHGMAAGQSFSDQPLAIKGDIVVGDGAWLGHGVTVLSGVRIGKGAVIGAGSTVAGDVPDDAVAWGVPAKVFMKRKRPVASPSLQQPVPAGETNADREAS